MTTSTSCRPMHAPGRSRRASRQARTHALRLARFCAVAGDRAAAVTVGVAVLLLYALTLAPTIVAGDAGELVTAAYELGVAHPPGYPLWTLLSHGFIALAGLDGDVAAKVNFFSAFCGALSCVLAYLLARRLGACRAAALGGGLLLGTSQQLWAQSVIAEVYALNLLLFMTCLWCLARWDRQRRRRWLLAFALLLGLGLANHHTIGILGPAGLAFVLWRNWRVILDWRTVVGSVLLFALPLSLYLYLPLASSASPYMDWGQPRSLDALFEHISRAQYKQSYEPQPRSATSFFFQFTQLTRDYLHQFSPAVGAAVLFLLPLALRRRRGGWIPLAVLGAGMALALALVINTKFERQEVEANQVFFIPVYACAAVLFAGELDVLIRRARAALRPHRAPKLMVLAVSGITLAPAGLAVAHNYAANDFSDYWYAEDHARNLLSTIERDGVIFPSGDHNTFPLIYLHRVERQRPDVTIADKYGYIEARQFPELAEEAEGARLDRNQVIHHLLAKTNRPVYFTVKQALPPVEGVRQTRVGMLYRAARSDPPAEPSTYWQRYRYRNADDLRDPPDYGAVNVAADFFFFRGLEELRAGEPKQALAAFAEARKLSRGIKQVMNNIGSALAEHGLIEPAQRYYDRALSLDQTYESAIWNQARTAKQVGAYDRATELFGRLRQIRPEDFRVPGELGFLYLKHFDLTQRARELFDASLALNPDQPQIQQAKRVIGDGPSSRPASVLDAVRTEHDFGEVVLGQAQTTAITIENVSDSALVLEKSETDCDCTSGSLTREQLAPGQTAQLKVRFHETERLGAQTRTLTVTPDKGPSLTVSIQAKVVHPIASEPVQIEIAEALPGQTLERDVTLTRRSDGEPGRIAEVSSDVAGLRAVWREDPDRNAPGGAPPPVAVTLETGQAAGQRTGRLKVVFADDALPPLEVPVTIDVRKPARLTPRSLFLSDLERSGEQTHEVTVDLAAGLQARVTDVVASDDWLQLLDPPQWLKGQTPLTIQLDTDALPETFNGTLTLETDHEAVSTIVIPIYGFAD